MLKWLINIKKDLKNNNKYQKLLYNELTFFKMYVIQNVHFIQLMYHKL